MNILIPVFFISFLSLIVQAPALVVAKIDEFHPLQVTLSQNSFNRIAVEGGTVKKVIAPEGFLDVQIDEHTGHAFITFKEQIGHSIAISVITEGGYIQDIEILARDQSTEVILLQENPTKPLPVSQTTREQAATILQGLSQGIYPIGYNERLLIPEDKKRTSHSSLVCLPFCAAEGPFERIVLYIVENTGKTPLPLHPSQFSEHQNKWVFLDQEKIAPKEKALLVVSKNREGL